MLARGLGVTGAGARDSVHRAEGGLDGGERDQGGDREGGRGSQTMAGAWRTCYCVGVGEGHDGRGTTRSRSLGDCFHARAWEGAHWAPLMEGSAKVGSSAGHTVRGRGSAVGAGARETEAAGPW